MLGFPVDNSLKQHAEFSLTRIYGLVCSKLTTVNSRCRTLLFSPFELIHTFRKLQISYPPEF